MDPDHRRYPVWLSPERLVRYCGRTNRSATSYTPNTVHSLKNSHDPAMHRRDWNSVARAALGKALVISASRRH